MEDRKASVLAAAVGCAAVGGFWLARPSGPKGTLKVVERMLLPRGGSGEDRDAAAAFRIELPASLRDSVEDGQAITLRIADREGNLYPLVPMAQYGTSGPLKLTRGYATTPNQARIEAVFNGDVLAAAPVGDLPPPTRLPLAVKQDSRIAAVYRGSGWLEAKNLVPIPSDERWHIVAKRTQYADALDAAADLPILSDRWRTQRLLVPYPEQAEAVDLEVTRMRLVERSVVVTIPNLRVEPRLGGTALVVDRPFERVTDLGKIRVPQQTSGPRRPVHRGDPRIANASVLLLPIDPAKDDAERRVRARLGYGVRAELLSPSPESLGLREIRLGMADRTTKVEPQGPLQKRTFTAVVRITAIEPKPFARFSATVPIIQGPPITNVPFGPLGWPPGDRRTG